MTDHLPEFDNPPLSGTGDVELQQLLKDEDTHIGDEELKTSESAASQRSFVAIGVSRRLYISHFLSTWNSRVFEFGAVLFIAEIFQGTLLPVSIYAVVRSASAIVLSSQVGRYIDDNDRLKVVRSSIGESTTGACPRFCTSNRSVVSQWASVCLSHCPASHCGHC